MKIIDLKDRFARILVAGTFASLTLVSLNLFSNYTKLVSTAFFKLFFFNDFW